MCERRRTLLIIGLALIWLAAAVAGPWYQPVLFDFALKVAYSITDDAMWAPRITYATTSLIQAVGLTTMMCAFVSVCLRVTKGTIVETRCRKCGYILKGLRDPVCPECGERI